MKRRGDGLLHFRRALESDSIARMKNRRSNPRTFMFSEATFPGTTSLRYCRGPAAGPPLVMVHGVTRRGADFAPVLAALSQRWEVFTLDQRGHGESARADSYVVRDYAADLADFLRQVVGRPAALFGHSLGALAA